MRRKKLINIQAKKRRYSRCLIVCIICLFCGINIDWCEVWRSTIFYTWHWFYYNWQNACLIALNSLKQNSCQHFMESCVTHALSHAWCTKNIELLVIIAVIKVKHVIVVIYTLTKSFYISFLNILQHLILDLKFPFVK